MGIKSLIKFINVILILGLITGCGSKIKETKMDVEIPKYSEITVLEKKADVYDIFKAEQNSLYKIGNFPNTIADMGYSINGSTVLLEAKSQGRNLTQNIIKIYKNQRMITLNSFYSASDLKLSNSGNKLAFRCYKNDSIDSALGLKVFDINSRKILDMKSNVMVSGNLYCWLDDNNILYYGSTGDKSDSIKIYRYNFESNKEEVYLDNIEGYCTYMLKAGNGLVYLKENADGTELVYYDKTSGTKILSKDVDNIYNAKFNTKTKELYFAGKEAGFDTPELYKISIKSGGVVRITYDFPSSIEKESNLCMDKAGNVYFTSMQGVYKYNTKDKSISLLSVHNGKYNVYQDENS